MMQNILHIGFNELNLHRIDLRVFDFNKSAVACYKKVGFKEEGIIRDARKMGEEYWSLIQFSILSSEWKIIDCNERY